MPEETATSAATATAPTWLKVTTWLLLIATAVILIILFFWWQKYADKLNNLSDSSGTSTRQGLGLGEVKTLNIANNAVGFDQLSSALQSTITGYGQQIDTINQQIANLQGGSTTYIQNGASTSSSNTWTALQTFNGGATFNSPATFNSTVTNNGPVTNNNTSTFNGNSVFNSPVTMNSSLTTNGPVTNNSSVTNNGSTIINGPLVVSPATCASPTTTLFCQNGNSFGALAVLGTNDANNLAIETNNTTAYLLDINANLSENKSAILGGGSLPVFDAQSVANQTIGYASLANPISFNNSQFNRLSVNSYTPNFNGPVSITDSENNLGWVFGLDISGVPVPTVLSDVDYNLAFMAGSTITNSESLVGQFILTNVNSSSNIMGSVQGGSLTNSSNVSINSNCVLSGCTFDSVFNSIIGASGASSAIGSGQSIMYLDRSNVIGASSSAIVTSRSNVNTSFFSYVSGLDLDVANIAQSAILADTMTIANGVINLTGAQYSFIGGSGFGGPLGASVRGAQYSSVLVHNSNLTDITGTFGYFDNNSVINNLTNALVQADNSTVTNSSNLVLSISNSNISNLSGSAVFGSSLTIDGSGGGDPTMNGAIIAGNGAVDLRLSYTGSDSWTNLSGGRLGVGTNTPEFSVDTNDGLMVRGTFGAGATLTTTGPGTRSFLYSRKNAFRMENVTSTVYGFAGPFAACDGGAESDDACVGTNTASFGIDNVTIGDLNFALGLANNVGGSGGNFTVGQQNIITGSGNLAAGVLLNTSGSLNALYGFGCGPACGVSGNNNVSYGFNNITGDYNQAYYFDDIPGPPQAGLNIVDGDYNYLHGNQNTLDTASNNNFVFGNTNTFTSASNNVVFGSNKVLTAVVNQFDISDYTLVGSSANFTSSITANGASFTNPGGPYIATIDNTGGGSGNGGLKIRAGEDAHTANTNLIGFYRPDDTLIGAVEQDSSTSVNYNTTSDARLKENIVDTHYNLDTLLNIKIHDYNYIGSDKDMTGVIAQELYKLYPQAVSVGGDDAKTNPWMVDYSKLSPLAIKGVQDLNTKLEAAVVNQNGKLDEANVKLEVYGLKVDSISEELANLTTKVNNLQQNFDDYKAATDKRIQDLENKLNTTNSPATTP